MFMWSQRRTSNPLPPKRLSRNVTVISMFFAGATIIFVFFGLLFALSYYLQVSRSFDALQTGLAFVPLTAVLTMSSLMSRSSLARYRHR